jgi:hypothetical protein
MNSPMVILFPVDRCRQSDRQKAIAAFDRLRQSLNKRRIAREIADAMDWERWDAPDVASE